MATTRAPLGALDTNRKRSALSKVAPIKPSAASVSKNVRAPEAPPPHHPERTAIDGAKPLEHTAINGVVTLSVQPQEEDPVISLCRMHARCLRGSRLPDFVDFKQKLKAEISSGNLCCAEDILLVTRARTLCTP